MFYKTYELLYHWKEYHLPRGFERFALAGKQHLIGAEIGVCQGKHSELMLKNANIDRLYCVDPYKPCPDFPDDNELEKCRLIAHKRLVGYSQVAFLYQDSITAASTLPSLDFAYIDGNHVYDAVKADISAWWPIIKMGGVLGGHDFAQGNNPSFNGVIKAVTEFSVSSNYLLNVYGLDWWIHKL